MKNYTYWVEAVYYIKEKQYRISFPDFGPQIEPRFISYTDDLNDETKKKAIITSKAAEILRSKIQEMLAADDELPAHSKDFPIDIRFVDSNHIEMYEITV